MNISEFLWCRPFLDSLKFGRVHGYYTMFDYHSKKIDFFFVKGAFSGLQEQVFFFHGLEDDTGVLMMSFEVRGKDEDIVHVYNHPSFVNLVLEDVVHVQLEGGRGVTEAEEHDNGFIETGYGNEGCFPLIIRMDEDVIVSPSDIDLSEIFRGAEFVEEWGN